MYKWWNNDFDISKGFRFSKNQFESDVHILSSTWLKLQDVQVWNKNLKIWHPVTLVPLEVQGRVLPFWKPPINISKDPDCHGCCSALNISQVMLKIVFLLVSYYKLLNTNAHDCNQNLRLREELPSFPKDTEENITQKLFPKHQI